jgi:RimJ/RimL family protein N-acetyltransferase
MTDWRYLKTGQLELRAISADDTTALYGLNSDPRVWTHLPSGVHTSPAQTVDQVARQVAAWECDGLGYWTAWSHQGSFAGVGGCAVNTGIAWNLYYRFSPEAHGSGLATELARAALSAAHDTRPDLPVTALILEHNLASKRVAENAGLTLAWRGPDPAGEAIRLVYADRDLPGCAVSRLIAHP